MASLLHASHKKAHFLCTAAPIHYCFACILCGNTDEQFARGVKKITHPMHTQAHEINYKHEFHTPNERTNEREKNSSIQFGQHIPCVSMIVALTSSVPLRSNKTYHLTHNSNKIIFLHVRYCCCWCFLENALLFFNRPRQSQILCSLR